MSSVLGDERLQAQHLLDLLALKTHPTPFLGIGPRSAVHLLALTGAHSPQCQHSSRGCCALGQTGVNNPCTFCTHRNSGSHLTGLGSKSRFPSPTGSPETFSLCLRTLLLGGFPSPTAFTTHCVPWTNTPILKEVNAKLSGFPGCLSSHHTQSPGKDAVAYSGGRGFQSLVMF